MTTEDTNLPSFSVQRLAIYETFICESSIIGRRNEKDKKIHHCECFRFLIRGGCIVIRVYECFIIAALGNTLFTCIVKLVKFKRVFRYKYS